MNVRISKIFPDQRQKYLNFIHRPIEESREECEGKGFQSLLNLRKVESPDQFLCTEPSISVECVRVTARRQWQNY